MLCDWQTDHLVTDNAGSVVGLVSLSGLRSARGEDCGEGDLCVVEAVMGEVSRVDANGHTFDTLAMVI